MGVLVSPRVREAFGGISAFEKTLDIVALEFYEVFEERNTEAIAIAAVKSTGNSSFRFICDETTSNSAFVPIDSIVRLLSNDDIYDYGWVFCHSHTNQDPSPSDEDDKTTCILSWIGKMIDKPLVDHWVYGLDEDNASLANSANFYSYSINRPTCLSPRLVFKS